MFARLIIWLEKLLITVVGIFHAGDPQRHLLEEQCRLLLSQTMQAQKDYGQCRATEANLKSQIEGLNKLAAIAEKKAKSVKGPGASQQYLQKRDVLREKAAQLSTQLQDQSEKTTRRKERLQELIEQTEAKKQLLWNPNEDIYTKLIRMCIAALVVGFVLAVCYSLLF